MNNFWKSYFLYVLRWIAAAVPGALLLDLVISFGINVYISMISTQAVLGVIVFWVDKYIIESGKDEQRKEA